MVYDSRIRKLGSLHPQTLLSANNLATTYAKLGLYDNAYNLYSKHTNALPTAPDALLHIADIWIEKEDWEKAQQALNLAEANLTVVEEGSDLNRIKGALARVRIKLDSAE